MPASDTHFETHLTITGSDNTSVDVLATETGLSRQHIKQAMQKGAVWLTQKNSTCRIRRATKTLKTGDSLHLYYDEKVLANTPPPPTLIADEVAYSIWYKPCGMFSQGSKWGDHCAISRWVEQHLKPERPAFIVHRLDRAASGLIIIAHQKRSVVALTKLFHDRKITKRYRAIVYGKFPEQTEGVVMENDIDGRKAHTVASVLDYDASKNCSLLDVDIRTGRKHQIRRHLSEINHPIVGDRLYGDNKQVADLQLTAYYLAFDCPMSGKKKEFHLPDALLPTLAACSP